MRFVLNVLCCILSIVVVGLHAPHFAFTDTTDLIIDRFSKDISADGLPAGWKPLIFKKRPVNTRYTVESDGGNYFLKAESRAAASGIYKEVNIDPQVYRIIRWRWRIENTLKNGDETKKSGDDYAGRIYITFQYDPAKAAFLERTKYAALKLIYGKYPPKAAINYIWANRLPKGGHIDNAFTNHVRMIAVESGDKDAGKWFDEERDIYEDYKMLFNEEPPAIMGIAIMTDTDNTGEAAVAYYDDIVLSME